MSRCATARAHANIALVKYWGKRDRALNLPATGSLSLTLEALTTTTTVEFGDELGRDTFTLDGQPAPPEARQRLTTWLDLVRELAGVSQRAAVASENNFPTASGLASSASGYAALAVAATCALDLELDGRELSELARRGSGSAARSLFGGFVLLESDSEGTATRCWARPLAVAPDFSVAMAIALVGRAAKATPSRQAMEHCAQTSPLYGAWLAQVPRDLEAATAALAAGDLVRLGEVAEANALAMHATALAARPAIRYWRPATVACMEAVAELRRRGLCAYFTIDAGPHVKVLTDASTVAAVADELRRVAGVSDVIVSGPGGPAICIDRKGHRRGSP